jgi:isoleucyl-tRNA synthetase
LKVYKSRCGLVRMPLDPLGVTVADGPESFQAADKEIMKRLKENGRLIVQSTLKHSYPFCWR